MRPDSPPNLIELAVSRALIAKFDASDWKELGLITNTRSAIDEHPRLLRALYWSDDDYAGCVYDVVPALLGRSTDVSGKVVYANLDDVESHLGLEAWLAENEKALYARLYETNPQLLVTESGEVLDQIDVVADRLDAAQIQRQIKRIRRDVESDPESAVGQAKELIESVLKTIVFRVTGAALPGQPDLPQLLHAVQKLIGMAPADVDTKRVNAQVLKRVLGSIGQLVEASATTRNAFGTGHGRADDTNVDADFAMLVISGALAAVAFLHAKFEEQHGAATKNTLAALDFDESEFRSGIDVAWGDSVHHPRFGRGTVVSAAGQGDSAEATVRFVEAGQKRLLLKYAPLRLANASST